MTTTQQVARRASLTLSPPSKIPWPPTTVLGSVVAVILPLNHMLPSVPRALWFACIVALIGMPILFMRTGLRPLYPAVWVFAGFASLVALLTATNAATVDENLFVGAQLVLLVGVGPFAMTANVLADPKFAQRVGIAYLIGQSLSAVAAIAQLLGRSVLGVEPLQGRAYGLSEHPNTLGYMSCLAILIALHFLLVSRRFRLLAVAALAANIMALIAAGSVSAMMALAVGLAVLIISMRDHLGKMTLGAGAVAVALWLLGRFSGVFAYLPSITGRYGQVTGQTESLSSWKMRTLTYDFAWHKIMQDPVFGIGLNPGYSGTYNGITVTHNVFLRAWYQGGILLAIAVALIVIAVLIVALRAMVEKKQGAEASVLVAIFAVALTSALFEQRHFWLPVLVACASISAAAIKRRDPIASQTSPETPGFRRDLRSLAAAWPDGARDQRHARRRS
jgi:O-antigen ligase